MNDHEHFMRIALKAAHEAASLDEIPVGAVLIDNNQSIIAVTANKTAHNLNPLAHAEFMAIQNALAQGKKFLYNYTLYVTLEPCVMCCGAILLARIGTLVYGCSDPKAGAAGSLYNIPKDKRFNHNPHVISGILQKECSLILKEFFAARRK